MTRSKTLRPACVAIHAALAITLAGSACGQLAAPRVDEQGTVHQPGFEAPLSTFMSDEAKASFLSSSRAPAPSAPRNITELRAQYDAMLRPAVKRLRGAYDVRIQHRKLGGVSVDIVTPTAGIPEENRQKVLLNLHSGSFAVGGGGLGGQLEAIPIAALARMTVIAVDYRQGPEHRFPAASEDVEAVYREILKSYPASGIGLYGCSAGGILTSQSLARLQEKNLPRPGAAGVFGTGAMVGGWGDSATIAPALNGAPIPSETEFRKAGDANYGLQYYAGEGFDFNDPQVSPYVSTAILSKFPPTLILSGTRDIGLSWAVTTHNRLAQLGVPAQLRIWEGAPHCHFASATSDPGIPEVREAWEQIARFFTTQLSGAQAAK